MCANVFSCRTVVIVHMFQESMEESFMKRLLVCSAALLMATSVIAAAELESGLKVGDHAGAFNVQDITGPNKGKSLCYR